MQGPYCSVSQTLILDVRGIEFVPEQAKAELRAPKPQSPNLGVVTAYQSHPRASQTPNYSIQSRSPLITDGVKANLLTSVGVSNSLLQCLPQTCRYGVRDSGAKTLLISRHMVVEQRSAPVRRRNGKQQACEPCRKRKLACDHDYPTCHRCQRRKISEQCVYLPPSKQGAALVRQHLETTTSPPSPPRIGRNLESLSNEITPDQEKHIPPGPQWPLFEGTRSWIGPTSFSAVYQENRALLGQLPSPPELAEVCNAKIWAELAQRRGLSSSKWVQLGVEVLRHVPETEQICDSLFSRHSGPNDGWVRLAGKMVSESLWKTFGSLLLDRREGNLEELSGHLCRNHGVTVREDATDTNVWLQSFTGENLQWEAMGILFTFWAFGVLASPVEDPIFMRSDGTMRGRREVVTQLKNCASSCIELYGNDSADSGNTLLVYLMYKRNLLDAVLETDAGNEALSIIEETSLRLTSSSTDCMATAWRTRCVDDVARFASSKGIPL